LNQRLIFGDYVLEPLLQRVTRAGEIVPLKPKAFDLLCVLLHNRERVVSKDELFDWLWPRQVVTEANLSQTVYEVRRALGETARSGSWIRNVPRRGYQFAGEVTPAGESLDPGAPRSIAVLPFRSLGAPEDNAHLGLGIADAIITRLARAGRMVVRPISAVARFGPLEQDVLEVARRLEVACVVEGAVQSAAGQLRASARLMRVRDGACLWADELTVPAGKVFEMQDRIAAGVAAATAHEQVLVEAPRRRRHGTEDPEVHSLYLKGRYCWHKWTPSAFFQAVDYLQQAIALDPCHAPSHAFLAGAWSTLAIYGVRPPREAFAFAREAARRAVELAPAMSEGHEMLGAIRLFFDWDPAAAMRSLDRAIEQNPDSCNARHLRALALAQGGHHAAALAEMLRALRADPLSLISHTDLGYLHYWNRDLDAALAACESTLRLDAGFAHVHLLLAHVLLALGRAAEASEAMDRSLALGERSPMLSGDRAYIRGRTGDAAEARSIIAAMQEEGRHRYIDPFGVALGYLGLAEHDAFFDWLERAAVNRSRDLVFLEVFPVMDAVRQDPRLEAFKTRHLSLKGVA
jgi:DNA-binding winged helix-turn-helix (wHTH) protein/tetratricopeptide (TPR) repeat protein